MKRNYSKALTDLLLTGNDPAVVLSAFVQTLTKRGHSKLIKPVFQEVIKTLEAKESKTKPVVTIDSMSAKVNEDAVKEALQKLGADNEPYLTKEDPSLIGGFTATFNFKKIDQSYKRALTSLYEATRTH